MPVNAKTPDYLKQYIVEQDATKYTPIDHASWRYILKISRKFFARHAHPLYLNGLTETGISLDRIPLIAEMDAKLSRFGWNAVAVSGFIPPAVFMEFLSRGILPIACDMRKIENIAYTPAPDIVHEAAGHAPIIADPEYAKYLRHYGELAEKAIFSKQDLDVYEAVRELSDIKEDPHSSFAQIEASQKKLDQATAAIDHDSEAAQLGRMGWWTIEYGLLGDPKDPKIYGAGLLSSVSESYNCLSKEIKKVPLTVDCVNTSYDITQPQPQLFIAPHFQALVKELDELASRMAFRQGGIPALKKAEQSKATTTTVLDTGIQISGALERYVTDKNGLLVFLKYSGPVQLSYGGEELEGQGPAHHPQGFSSPIGKIKNQVGNELQKPVQIEFESGTQLKGILTGRLERGGKLIRLSFKDCRVTSATGETLFDPDWGTFDLACGTEVVSVYGGAADRSRYLAATGGFKQEPGRQKTNLTDENRELNHLYDRMRKLRDSAQSTSPAATSQSLAMIHAALESKHPDEWLLRYELLEFDAEHQLKSPWGESTKARLLKIAQSSKTLHDLIHRGLETLRDA